jgi:tetratricopeptide (TPR) repeat protein
MNRPGDIVGRNKEIEELERGLDDAKKGRGRLYVIAGEGGIGKTRLAKELARRAIDRGFTVAWGRCAEVGGAPAFWPWVQILRALRRRSTGSSLERLLPELRGSDAAGAGSGSGSASGSASASGSGPGSILDPMQGRLALFEDIVDALRQVTQEGAAPLTLIFEDLHAADPSSLALVHFLTRDLADADAHVLVVVTYRVQELKAHSDRGEAVHRIAREAAYLPLRRFTAEECRLLLKQYANEDVDRVFVERVHATTEGNALFVEEVARALGNNGNSSSAVATLPSGVRDAIQKRLETLDAETLEVLRVASVSGRDLDDLSSIAALMDRQVGDVRSLLERAESFGIVTELGTDAFTFSHVLVRDALYAQIPAARRAALHAALADYLTKTNAPERAAAEVATHLLDAIDTVGPARAFSGSLDAAKRAAAAFAFEDVIAILTRAMNAIPKEQMDPRARAEGLVLLGEAHVRVGEAEQGRVACVEAGRMARELGDAQLLAAAALACGAEITVALIDNTLLGLLRDALLALPESEIALRARVLARLAGAEQPASDPQVPIAKAREAIALARQSGDLLTLRIALEFGGSALVDYADPEERAPLAIEMRDLAMQAGDWPSAFRAQMRLFFDHLERGDRASAIICADEIQRIAERLRWPRLRGSAVMTRACLALIRGGVLDALEHFDLARDLIPKNSDLHVTFPIAVALLQDSPEDIEPLANELLRLGETLSTTIVHWSHLVMAMGRARRGDLDGARKVFSVVPEDSPILLAEPNGIAMSAEIATFVGDKALAARLVPLARTYATRFVSWGQQGMSLFFPFTLSIAQLEETLGNFDAAFEAYAEAEARAARGMFMMARAWILYFHARSRHLAKQDERARSIAARGIDLCSELRLDRLATRFHALGVLLSPPPPPVKTAAAGAFGALAACAPEGAELRFKDSRGFRMLSRLMSEPGREMHVMLLAGEGVDVGDLGSAGEVIDQKAIAKYKGRIDDLRDGIEEAEGFGDVNRAEKLREELDFLVRELAAGVGLGGRSRKAAAAAERARVNVQRRLKDAIRRMGEQSPALGEYLGWTIRTGTFCSYRPPTS